MTWQEYQTMQAVINSKQTGTGYWVKTEVDCPECGGPVYKNIGCALTSWPVQYRYECWDCHWNETGQ